MHGLSGSTIAPCSGHYYWMWQPLIWGGGHHAPSILNVLGMGPVMAENLHVVHLTEKLGLAAPGKQAF